MPDENSVEGTLRTAFKKAVNPFGIGDKPAPPPKKTYAADPKDVQAANESFRKAAETESKPVTKKPPVKKPLTRKRS